ncbi:protein NLP3-like [Nymphaea colorata]|nr:protein NLP3-like [Nymphaea colorata]
MDFDLEAFELNWVNDLISEDTGGDGNGKHKAEERPPSCELFSDHHPPDSNDAAATAAAAAAAPSSSLNWLAIRTLNSMEERSRIIKQRLSQALRYYVKQSTEHHALVQVWVPVKSGGRYLLTTSGQPFVLGPRSPSLSSYRIVSVSYFFSTTDEDCTEDYVLGLPGRVFRRKMPEWTPNVQYYSSEEYPRLSHALHYDVRGSLALPVFESWGRSCVAVIEIIMTSMKINYAPDVDRVCKALEAVNLKSSEVLDHPQLQICNEGRQAALAEILEIITVVCEMHRLPLAQTWVPCTQHSAIVDSAGMLEDVTVFDGSCTRQACMSISDIAFYVVDADMWGFRDACAEHHLQKGHGVPGRAFATHAPCFSCDITQFSKTEYPLVHYARMFGLVGSLAIYLESEHTGKDGYVIEFFLPSNLKDIREQQFLLESLLATLKQCCHTLRVVIDYELIIENIFPSVEPSASHKHDEGANTIGIGADYQVPLESPETEVCPVAGDVYTEGKRLSLSVEHSFEVLADGLLHENSITDTDVDLAHASAPDNSCTKGLSGSKRGKAEKSISLDVLQKYFAGSLKDAAKSLGVCPTTMKRICRQYGITRWPSRKIKKVNRSIYKLQQVIESVPVAQGTFNLTTLTSPLPVAMGSSSSLPPNFTAIEPQKFMCTSARESMHEANPVDAVIAETGDPERQMASHDCSHLQPKLDEHHPGLKSKLESGEQNIRTVASRRSSQGTPQDVEATELVDWPSADYVLEHERVHLNESTEFGSSALGEPCPATNEEPTSSIRNATCTDAMAVKAMYKEDIVRFRLSSVSSLIELKEEVAKRLKLGTDIFDVKYLDDDQEWILLACEDDFQECIDIVKSCGKHLIRLLISEMVPNLGSSCDSSGGLT